MNEQEAEQALAIVRELIENTREDLIDQNWGLIWMLHAFTSLAAFVYLGHAVEARAGGILDYLIPLAIVAAVNLVIALSCLERDRGIRSAVEWQVHGIWTTYIVFSLLGAAVLYLSESPPTLLCPLMSMTSGIGFAMMGVVFFRRFLLPAAAFLVVGAVAAFLPVVQWDVFGLVWWGALLGSGYGMHREKQRRKADGGRVQVL